MIRKSSPVEVKAFDLFCSVGGLTHGLIHSGIDVVAGADLDASCKYAYEENNSAKFLEADIRGMRYEAIKPFFVTSDCRVLVGCAPCQPFSSHTNKTRKEIDESWNLVSEFLRIIKEGMPEIVSMENVPNLTRQYIFNSFTEGLQELGYMVNYRIVSCNEFGVPQTRRRLVLLASLLGHIEFNETKKKSPTVRQAIGALEPLENGQRSATDPLHFCSRLSPINIRRIKASIPGGTWCDWPTSLLPDCYRKDSGASYKSVYGRMEWDKPAPTLTTQFYRYGTGRYGHPVQHRALSLREGAILQTFPANYEFVPPNETVNFTSIGRHIGNAVPPAFGRVIGKSILKHVGKYYG